MGRQAEPSVLLKLDTVDPDGTPKEICLGTDPTTLKRLTKELEAALASVKTSHYRRITRAIK